MDYRRECNPNPKGHPGPGATLGHPTAITPGSGINLGATKIYGVQRQPFINEVYVVNNGTADTTTKTNSLYSVYIELANPYDQALVLNTSFTKLTIGTPPYTQTITPKAGTSIVAASGPGQASGYVVGIVVSIPMTKVVDADAGLYVEPVCLYNTATDGTSLLIDRMNKVWPATPTKTNTQSRQRPTYNITGAQPPGNGTAYAHGVTSVPLNFFGGYMEGPTYDLWAKVQMAAAPNPLTGTAGTPTDPAGTYNPTCPAHRKSQPHLVCERNHTRSDASFLSRLGRGAEHTPRIVLRLSRRPLPPADHRPATRRVFWLQHGWNARGDRLHRDRAVGRFAPGDPGHRYGMRFPH
jgi:hypothetical protein